MTERIGPKGKKPHPSQEASYIFPTTAERLKEIPLSSEAGTRTVNWGLLRGGHDLMDLQSAPHFLTIGSTRSGKTTLSKLFLTSVLPASNSRFPLRYRAIVNDPKTELVTVLGQAGLDVTRDVIIANPFDKRSSSWAIWLDVVSDIEIQTLTELICPLDSEAQKSEAGGFFSTVANSFINAVVKGLVKRAHEQNTYWDLRDVVCSCGDTDTFAEILKSTEEGVEAYQSYLAKDPKLAQHAFASLKAPLTKLRTTAALWEKAETYFSIKTWREKGAIILLGYRMSALEKSQLPNYMIVRNAIQTILDQPGDDYLKNDELSWIFLDEISSIGETPGLLNALNMGAGKGIRVFITELGFSSLKTSFPNDTWEQVVNACRNKAILNLDNVSDRQFASDLIGQRPFNKTSQTRQHDGSPGSTNTHEDRDFIVPPEYFATMPLAGPDGVTACFITEHGFIFPDASNTMSGPEILAALPPEGEIPEALIPRDDKDQELTPWNDDDRLRLGLKKPRHRKPRFI